VCYIEANEGDLAPEVRGQALIFLARNCIFL
jgi:hypothetical protein